VTSKLNGSLKITGLLIGVLVIVAGIGSAWGGLSARVGDNEAEIRTIRTQLTNIERLVVAMAAKDGIRAEE
jgi:hypothetical protein